MEHLGIWTGNYVYKSVAVHSNLCITLLLKSTGIPDAIGDMVHVCCHCWVPSNKQKQSMLYLNNVQAVTGPRTWSRCGQSLITYPLYGPLRSPLLLHLEHLSPFHRDHKVVQRKMRSINTLHNVLDEGIIIVDGFSHGIRSSGGLWQTDNRVRIPGWSSWKTSSSFPLFHPMPLRSHGWVKPRMKVCFSSWRIGHFCSYLLCYAITMLVIPEN